MLLLIFLDVDLHQVRVEHPLVQTGEHSALIIGGRNLTVVGAGGAFLASSTAPAVSTNKDKRAAANTAVAKSRQQVPRSVSLLRPVDTIALERLLNLRPKLVVYDTQVRD